MLSWAMSNFTMNDGRMAVARGPHLNAFIPEYSSGAFHSPRVITSRLPSRAMVASPYMLSAYVPANAESGSVSVRDRWEGDLGAMPIGAAINRLREEITTPKVRKTYSGSAQLEAKGAANEY